MMKFILILGLIYSFNHASFAQDEPSADDNYGQLQKEVSTRIDEYRELKLKYNAINNEIKKAEKEKDALIQSNKALKSAADGVRKLRRKADVAKVGENDEGLQKKDALIEANQQKIETLESLITQKNEELKAADEGINDKRFDKDMQKYRERVQKISTFENKNYQLRKKVAEEEKKAGLESTLPTAPKGPTPELKQILSVNSRTVVQPRPLTKEESMVAYKNKIVEEAKKVNSEIIAPVEEAKIAQTCPIKCPHGDSYYCPANLRSKDEVLPVECPTGLMGKSKNDIDNIKITIKPDAPAPPKPNIKVDEDCKSKAVAALVKKAMNKNPRLLQRMFELSSLKMAYQLSSNTEVKKSLEELLKTKVVSSNADALKKELKDLYVKYGVSEDSEKMKLFEDLKKLRYSRGETSVRLKNDNASALVLFLSKQQNQNDKFSLSSSDASTIWAVEKLRSEAEKKDRDTFKIGSQSGNQLNFSSRVFALLDFNRPQDIAIKLNEKENQVSKAFESAVASLDQQDLKKCLGCETAPALDAKLLNELKDSVAQLAIQGSQGSAEDAVALDPSKTVLTDGQVVLRFKSSERAPASSRKSKALDHSPVLKDSDYDGSDR